MSPRTMLLGLDGVNIVEALKTDDIPFGQWVSELAQLEEERDDKGYCNRTAWIHEKLDQMDITYHYDDWDMMFRKLGSDEEFWTRMTIVPFQDDLHKPVVQMLILTNWIDNRHDYATGIVQMLMLAQKLKKTTAYVNVNLVFVDDDIPGEGAFHLNEMMQRNIIPGEVGSILLPTCFMGPAIALESPMDGDAGWVFEELQEHYQLELAAGPMISKLIGGYEELERYELTYLGSDQSEEEADEHPDKRSIQERQIAFAQTDAFDQFNTLLYQGVVSLSHIYGKYELDTYFYH